MNSPTSILAFAVLLLHVRMSHLATYNNKFEVQVECEQHKIVLHINAEKNFWGMVYPQTLTASNGCVKTYDGTSPNVTYELPFYSCNTIVESVHGITEIFNHIVIHPHHKLITSPGRHIDIHCRYFIKDNALVAVNSAQNKSETGRGIVPGDDKPPFIPILPESSMKIYSGAPGSYALATTVEIGKQLTMVINIAVQDNYALKVSDCDVRDGNAGNILKLIDEHGCPIQEAVMGPFTYSQDGTSAHVVFTAHKFPFSSAVYYSCSVHTFLKAFRKYNNVPPMCGNGTTARLRRDLSEYQTNKTGVDVRYLMFVKDKKESTEPKVSEQEHCLPPIPYAAVMTASLSCLAFLSAVITALLLRYCKKCKEGMNQRERPQYIPDDSDWVL